MRLKYFLLITLICKPLIARDYQITNRDIAVLFPVNSYTILASAGVFFDFENGDNLTLPLSAEVDFQWAKFRKKAFSIGMQTGLYTIFGLQRIAGNSDWMLDELGINILRIMPMVNVTDRVGVFLNLVVFNYDFHNSDFAIGTFGPLSEVGIQFEL